MWHIQINDIIRHVYTLVRLIVYMSLCSLICMAVQTILVHKCGVPPISGKFTQSI